MRNWTIGRRLLAGVGALITLIVAVAVLALWVGRSLEGRLIHTNDHTVKRLGLALQIETELERLYATQPALVMAGYMNDKSLVEGRKLATAEAIAEVNGSLTAFRAEASTAADRQAIEDLASDLDGWTRANDDVARLVAAGNAAEAAKAAIKSGDKYKAKSRAATDEIVGREQGELQEDLETVKVSTASVRTMVFTGVFIAFLVAGLAVRSMINANRSLWTQSQALREGTEHVVAAAGQVATSAQVAVAGRDRAGGVARGDVGVDGRDGVDDAQERGERARRRRRSSTERRRSRSTDSNARARPRWSRRWRRSRSRATRSPRSSRRSTRSRSRPTSWR